MSLDNQEKDTLEGSSPEGKPTEPDTTVDSVNEASQSQPESKPTVEEVEFRSLSGSAQDRIRTLIQERNMAREQLSRQAQTDVRSVSPAPSPDTNEDEVARAARLLRDKAGMVNREDLNTVLTRLDRMETDRMHAALENEFNGADGKPKYVREEVEDYARRNNIWNLKAAYRDMYFDELQDSAREKKRQVYSSKPRVSTPQETVTLDSFRAKLRGEKGREYFDQLRKNPQEFDKLLQQLTTADE